MAHDKPIPPDAELAEFLEQMRECLEPGMTDGPFFKRFAIVSADGGLRLARNSPGCEPFKTAEGLWDAADRRRKKTAGPRAAFCARLARMFVCYDKTAVLPVVLSGYGRAPFVRVRPLPWVAAAPHCDACGARLAAGHACAEAPGAGWAWYPAWWACGVGLAGLPAGLKMVAELGLVRHRPRIVAESRLGLRGFVTLWATPAGGGGSDYDTVLGPAAGAPLDRLDPFAVAMRHYDLGAVVPVVQFGPGRAVSVDIARLPWVAGAPHCDRCGAKADRCACH